MNRAPIALCGLLCTLGSTLIAAGMSHDGSPCEFLPKPQPRIGVLQTAPCRNPLASYDPTERWLAPDLWRQADLLPVERRHEKVVPTPVKQENAATKPAAGKPTAVQPVVSKPVVAKPVVAKPVASQPVAAKAAAAKPVAAKPAPQPAAKPVAAKTAATKPQVTNALPPKAVAQKPAALKNAAVKPAITRAVSLPIGYAAQSPLPAAKLTDLSLPRLVKAAELASQSDVIHRWIADQDGIDDGESGIHVGGSSRPLDQSVVDFFVNAARPAGLPTPWTVALHVGPQTMHVYDSNLGFGHRGVRVVRSVTPVEPKLWIEDQRQIAEGYRAMTRTGVARMGSAAHYIKDLGTGLVDLGLHAGNHINQTAESIAARLPSKLPTWNGMPGPGNKPTEIGGKPAKVRSAELPGNAKK